MPFHRFTRSLSHTTVSIPGFHWLGPFRRFVMVPSTILTLEFGSPSGTSHLPTRHQHPPPSYGLVSPSIAARSKDGLSLGLVVSVQWRYSPLLLPDLLLSLPGVHFNGNAICTPGVKLVRSIAFSSISEVARRFHMSDWLTRKENISRAILQHLRGTLSRYAEVVDLQLMHVTIPAPIEAALLHSAVSGLFILRAMRYREAMAVAFRAMAMAARFNYTQTVNLAIGRAKEEEQRGITTAAIVSQCVIRCLGRADMASCSV